VAALPRSAATSHDAMSYALVQFPNGFMEAGIEVVSAASDDGREALIAARHGDERAGRRLMSHHGPSMLRTAWSVLGRYGGREAEDVVQEAFIAALTTRALPRGNVGAWLRAIAVRKALDWLRKTRRRGERLVSESDESPPEPVAAQDPQAALDAITVRRGLARLTATDRAVLTLVDLEGHSMAEAAATLGLTRVATKLRAVRARKKLARILDGDGPSASDSRSRRRGGMSS